MLMSAFDPKGDINSRGRSTLEALDVQPDPRGL